MLLEQQYQNNANNLQQQQQVQIQSLGGGGMSQQQNGISATGAAWIYPYMHSSPYEAQPQQPQQSLYRQSYDAIRPNKLLEYDHRHTYNDTKEAYESRYS